MFYSVYVLDGVLYEIHEFSGGSNRKKGEQPNTHTHIKEWRKIPNKNVLTAVTYAHENTISTKMGERKREKKRDEQIKMGRIHFCSLVNHSDVVGLQLQKKVGNHIHEQSVLYADATQKLGKTFLIYR